MKAHLIVDNDNKLMPADDETWEYINRRKPGQVIVADIKQSRNYDNHKRFFSFIKATFNMQDFFEEPEAYRYWLILKCGYFDIIIAPNGTQIFKAKSIDFDSMDEDEFNKLFNTAIDVFLKTLGKGITEDELLRVVEYG